MSIKNFFKPRLNAPKTVAASATTPSTSIPADDEHYERSHKEILVVMGALMSVMLLAALDQTIVATALPRIAVDLHGLDKYAWVATSYLMTSAISTPIYGKIGDLFGRKRILQIAVVIFLVGSFLSGFSHSMNELVAFRALQGIGAGGLMSLVLAIIGDVIPPRQRGRYQGYFGAVFGLSSVVGPLLGGFLSDAPAILGITGWRWIFYINIPIGIIALSVVAAKLHLPKRRIQRKIDYLGAALLSLAVVSLVLITAWGGVTYAWGSAVIIGLAIAAIFFSATFALWERRASEPLLPIKLFKNDIFSVSVILSALTGIAMFAAILYIPQYQQVVRGYSPTKSGLAMLPLVAGMMIASITSGRLITKFGRYKFFPLFGTAMITLGMWLFSHVTLHTSLFELSIWMFIIGIGLGSFMQVATLAVQNSVKRAEMGVATSATAFFRTIGSSLGGAIFGTILIARLTSHLMSNLPADALKHISVHSVAANGTSQLAHLPAAAQHDVLLSFIASFHDMFLIGIPFALAAFVVALFLRETPLRTSTKDMAEGSALEVGSHEQSKNTN